MLLSARALLPLGRTKTTLPCGNPKTRSISVCALQTDASLRIENMRLGVYSRCLLLRAIGPLPFLITRCVDSPDQVIDDILRDPMCHDAERQLKTILRNRPKILLEGRVDVPPCV